MPNYAPPTPPCLFCLLESFAASFPRPAAVEREGTAHNRKRITVNQNSLEKNGVEKGVGNGARSNKKKNNVFASPKVRGGGGPGEALLNAECMPRHNPPKCSSSRGFKSMRMHSPTILVPNIYMQL